MRNANLPKARVFVRCDAFGGDAAPLPKQIIQEAMVIDPASPTGLRWTKRPQSHFVRNQDWITWNLKYSGNQAGSVSVDKNGREYWRVGIDCKLYLVHRVIYFLAYGIDPGKQDIDHLDNNGKNNNLSNLRLASRSENSRNRRKQLNNTSGHIGIGWHKQANKWQAKIKLHGKQIYLGLFSELREAIEARKAAEIKYFGEYSYSATQSALSDSDEILGDAGWAY